MFGKICLGKAFKAMWRKNCEMYPRAWGSTTTIVSNAASAHFEEVGIAVDACQTRQGMCHMPLTKPDVTGLK